MYIQTENLNKSYGSGDNRIQVLNRVSMTVERGRMCVILGPSGSGKSTLLNAIGGLDTVDSGRIQIDGQTISGLSPKALSDYRRETLGFVFQFYNLIPDLTVRENIQVCRYLSRTPLPMDELLDTLGLYAHQHKYPSQLSGGQQQRCAIARALIKNPALLLCDEPTGALDSRTAKEILILLEKINQRYGTTMLIVTHNNAISRMTHQVIKLRDGQIREAYENKSPVSAADISW